MSASTARTGSPTTASSTKFATSSPAPSRGSRIDGVALRADDLRGPLGARPARLARGRGRARADPQPLGLALSARQGRATASGCSPSAPATTGSRSPSATWSAARTSSSSMATASSSTRRARSSRGRGSSSRTCCSGISAARHAARSSEPLADLDEVYAALELGLARLRAQERLRACRSSASPAGSTRPWSRCSPPTRSAPSGSPAWSCPRRTRAPRPRPTRARSPPTSAPS